MNYLLRLAAIFLLATFELWGAIPLGFWFGVHPLLNILLSASGAIVGTMLVVYFGGKIQARLLKKSPPGAETKSPYLKRIWHKHGIIGLGLVAPLLTGAPIGAVIAIALGAPKPQIVLWISIGAIIWSIGLTMAGVLGFEGISQLAR